MRHRPSVGAPGALLRGGPARHDQIAVERRAAPQRREGQEKLWRDLRTFAKNVKLTDEQWDRLVNDLIELATADQKAWLDPSKADLPARHELTVSLERDLEARCASYMTKDQVAELRFRYLSGLISRARQVVVPLPTDPEPTGS